MEIATVHLITGNGNFISEMSTIQYSFKLQVQKLKHKHYCLQYIPFTSIVYHSDDVHDIIPSTFNIADI